MTQPIKTTDNKLDKAIEIATEIFKNKVDKAGQPYLLHCVRTMKYLKTDDEELQCIAILHDVIEDSFDLIEEGAKFLESHGFSHRVVVGVCFVTRRDFETYDQYLEKIAFNNDAILVKLADLKDNLNTLRLQSLGSKDLERIKKYHDAYRYLEKFLIPKE